MNSRLRFIAPLLLAACSCASSPPASNGDAAPVVQVEKPASSASAEPPAPAAEPAPAKAKELGEDAELEEGHVVFQGMVRPTKGGYDVRGVVLDGDDFKKAIASDKSADPKKSDWFLGAVVRVTAELSKHTAEPPAKGDEAIQTRTGTWLQAKRIESISVVKPAQVVEGTLNRSKGLFSLDRYMIDHHDLDWALAPNGAHSGDRVRVYGQPHTYVCRPNEQCLIDGSIPFFDVGRAERLP